MNFRQYLLAVITGLFVLLNFSCAKISSSAGTEVVFDDGYQTQAKKNEVTIDDSSFSQTSQLSTKREAHEETPVQLKDGSILTVSFDAFGNKTEKREFPGDSRLLMLSVTTSADGKQEIMVRGRNLERKSLPPEMFDRVLTTSADEIAQTAGIFAAQRETELPPVIAMRQEQQQQTKQIYQPAQIPQQNLPPNTQTVNKEDLPADVSQQSGEQKAEPAAEKPHQTSSLLTNSDRPESPKTKGTNQ